MLSDSLSSLFFFFVYWYGDHRDLHSFPTRRSSDLSAPPWTPFFRLQVALEGLPYFGQGFGHSLPGWLQGTAVVVTRDRKSTRLNSSHRCISYAVFCLKKKNNQHGHSHDLRYN